MQKNYKYYKQALFGIAFPLCFLDVDLLKENCNQIKSRITNSKKIRIASKSIRSTEVMKMIMNSDSDLFCGIMCFSMAEAVFLSQKGFNDLLVAYPGMQEKLIEDVCVEINKGKTIVLMVDCKNHVDKILSIAKKMDVVVPVCLDIDMSTDFPGLHFGVWRSSLFNTKQVIELVNYIKKNNNIKLDGLMGYEAQIAGVGDHVPKQTIKNKIIQLFKKISQKEISKRRKEIVDAIHDFKHQPSLGFAIEIVRNPKPNVYTCHGGGYIASGSVGKEKMPIPYLPEGITLFENEGVGEVQTPFTYSGTDKLEIGDPIFMRHAKAGELCERFNELVFISNGKVIGKASTYRGEGMCFL